jgi:hypothetical protein
MLIQISIEKTKPLTGSASCSGNQPLKFVGWLELFRAVADLVKATEQAPENGRASCQSAQTSTLGDRNLS